MKAYVVMVMVLALGVFGASSPAFADCPNHNVSCAWGATGWQGTCWRGFKGCQNCGPQHCPSTNGYGLAQMPYQVHGACVQRLLQIGAGNNKVHDGCSVPLNDPASVHFKEAFRGACDEHDTCYHVPGINKAVCDNDFRQNMKHVCDSYYTGARNVFAHGLCEKAADTWAVSVWLAGKDSFDRDQASGKSMCQ